LHLDWKAASAISSVVSIHFGSPSSSIAVKPHEVAIFAILPIGAALAVAAAVARLQFMDSGSKLRHTIFEILVLFFEGPATVPPGVRNGTNCGSASVCHGFEKAERAQLLNWKRASGDD
jgi:hypothetical protein